MKSSRWKRRGKSLCLAVMLLVSLLPIHKTEAAEKTVGSIVIQYYGTAPDGERIALEDAVFDLYRVGDVQQGHWNINEEFMGSGVSFEDMSASDQRTAAKELHDYAKNQQLAGKSEVTDREGKAIFYGLEEGVYLAAQESGLAYGDGWFYSDPFLFSIPMDDGEGNWVYDLKAEPKNEWFPDQEPVTIGLRDLTIYTGGNEKEGNLNGFPAPRYTGIPQEADFCVNGEAWDDAKGYPFTVVYTVGEEQKDLSVEDTGEYAPEDTEAGLYIAHIVPKERGAEITVKQGDSYVPVQFSTAVLTIRAVLDKDSNEQLGVIVSEASEQKTGMASTMESLTENQKEELDNGLAVVSIPEGSRLSVNGDDSLGVVGIEEAALLFDDILYFNVIDQETGNMVLEDRAAKALKDMGKEMDGRCYQSKYLDLVQDQDGNLWLSSSKGSTVYWPYPEGTDEKTEFTLFHYRGLHREYGIKGNPEESIGVYTAPQEQVEIEKTEYGIRFYIPESGFSPFVLSWVPSSGEIPEESKPGDNDGADTGDDSRVLLFSGLCIGSIGMAIAVYTFGKRKKRKNRW